MNKNPGLILKENIMEFNHFQLIHYQAHNFQRIWGKIFKWILLTTRVYLLKNHFGARIASSSVLKAIRTKRLR